MENKGANQEGDLGCFGSFQSESDQKIARLASNGAFR